MTLVLDVFRVIAACSSLFMLLSPTPMVYKMHKDRDTGVMSIVPLLAVLLNSNTWMMYGYLDEDYVPIFATFVGGDIVALVYIAIYYRSSKNRPSVHSVLALTALFIATTSLYGILAGLGYTGQTRHQAAQVFGIIGNFTGLFVYASPLVKIVQVFKYKSAVFIPVHMVSMGTVNNAIWITYSVLAHRWLIVIPNIIAIGVGLFQVILYFFIYHPRSHPLPAEYFATAEARKGDHGPTIRGADDVSLSLSIVSPGAYSIEFLPLDSARSSMSLPTPGPAPSK